MKQMYDNTMLTSHRGCNRRYFFRHRAHIRSQGIAMPLVFGLAWHSAMDGVWGHAQRGMDDDKLVQLAYLMFLETWKEQGLPTEIPHEMMEQWNPRIPGVALEMLYHYVKLRRPFIQNDVKILQIEMPFAVPIDPDDPDLIYIGRMDKVIEWKGRIWGVEHKTSSWYKKNGYFRSDFIDSFSPNSQIDGYMHALKMNFGQKVKGILVDAALVHKTVHEGFMFIPCSPSDELLNAWLYDVHKEIGRIQENVSEEFEVVEEDIIMAAWPKDTSTCSSFFGRPCPYIDICKGRGNPLSIANPSNDLPLGFEREEWRPWEILKLEEAGIEI